MTEDEQRSDVPKIMATIGVKFPALAVRLGVSYLRLKRGRNRAEKVFVTELQRSGMPSEDARRLGAAYASDVSIRRFMKQAGAGGIQGLRMR